jgi:hypothetical protein
MTVAELATACAAALEPEHTGTVALVVPGPAPRGERVRLDRGHRRKCPMGEVLNWQKDRGTLARFDAADVLAYLAANRLIEFKAEIVNRDQAYLSITFGWTDEKGRVQLEIAGSGDGRK